MLIVQLREPGVALGAGYLGSVAGKEVTSFTETPLERAVNVLVKYPELLGEKVLNKLLSTIAPPVLGSLGTE
jgi:hypothetical protein